MYEVGISKAFGLLMPTFFKKNSFQIFIKIPKNYIILVTTLVNQIFMQKKILLIGIITFQILILVGMLGKAFYPLWIGEEVIFRVLPRDPRDIFRGNYVDLQYTFNNINLNELANDLDRFGKYRFGDKLYVELALKNGFYEPVGLWQHPPESKKFLQVIAEDTYGYDTLQSISVKAGIESYFTSAENALKVEKLTLNDSVQISVSVMLAPDGKARIKKINTKPIKRQQVSQGDNSLQ